MKALRTASSPSRLPLLLAGLCAVAVTVIYLGLQWDPLVHARTSPLAAAGPGASAVEPGFSMPALASFSETAIRPLFAETRRPAAEPATPAAARAPLRRLDASLVGIVLKPGERWALVRGGADKEPRRVLEGQSVDGWRVVRILADRIVVEGDGTQEIRLHPETDTGESVSPSTSDSRDRRRSARRTP